MQQQEAQLSALLEEYKLLSSTVEKYSFASLQTLPLSAAVAAGIAAYTSDKPAFAGIIMAYGLVMAVVGLSFIMSSVSGQGLRLVELEVMINRLTEMPANQGLGWYGRTIGKGVKHLPGFSLNVWLIGGLAVAAILLAVVIGMRALFPGNSPQEVPLPIGVIVASVPVVVLIGTLFAMRKTDVITRERKRTFFMSMEINGAMAKALRDIQLDKETRDQLAHAITRLITELNCHPADNTATECSASPAHHSDSSFIPGLD